MSLLHRKKQPWCQKDCSVHHSVLRRQSSALWKYTGPICACAPITVPHAIRFHIPTSSTSAARLTANTQPVAQPATQPPTQGKMKALRNCSFGNLLPLEIDQPAFSEAVARVQLPWKSTRTRARVHTSEHETKYYIISKCHMKQILSCAPAAFFFHSYAYAQSISPAILRFALGCHDVART